MPDFNYNSNLNYNAGSLNFTKDSGNPVWDKRLFTFAHNVDNFLIDNNLLLPPYFIDYGTGQTPLEFLQQYKIKTYQQLDVQSLEKINTQLREMGKSQILEQRLSADVLAVLLKAPGFENVSLTDLADRLGQAEYKPFPSEKFNFSPINTSQPTVQIQPTVLQAGERFSTPDNAFLDNTPHELPSEMGYTGPIQTKNVLIGTISPQIVRAEIDRILNLHRENPLFPDLSNDESTSIQPRFASNEYNAAFNLLLPSLDALSLRPISSLTPAQQEAFRQEIMSNLTSRNLSRYIAGVLLAEKTGVITKADLNNVQWDQFLSREHIEIPFTLLDDNLFHWPMLQKYQPEPSVLATYTDDVNATARITPPMSIPSVRNQDIMPNIPSPAVATIDGVAVSAPDLHITDTQQQVPDSGFLNMDMPELAQQPTVSIPTNIPSISNQDIMPNIPSPAVATVDGVAVSAPDLHITDTQQHTSDSGFLNMDMPKLAQQPTVSIPTNIPSVSNQDIMPNIPSPAIASVDGVAVSAPDLHITDTQQHTSDSGFLNMDMPKLAQQPTVSIPTNIPPVSNQDIMPNIPSPAVATIDGVSLKQIEPIDLPISASIVFNENAIPSSLNFEMQALTAHIDKSKKSKSSEEARQESKDTEKKQSQLDNLRAQKQALLQGRNLEQLSDEERARIQAIDNEINELQAHISTPAQNTKPGAGNPTTQTTQTTFATQSSQTTFSPSQSGRYGTPDRNATASHLPEVESSAKADSGASSASQTGYTQAGGRQRMSSSTKATDKQSKTPAQVSPITPEPTATATPTQATQTAPTPTVTPAQALQAVSAPMTMPAQVSTSALPSGEDKKKKEMQNLPPEAVVQESEEKSFWTWKNILLILTIVGTLGIGAYFIIRYKKKADDAKKQSSSLQSTVNDLQAQVDDLKSNTASENSITTGIDDGLTKSTSLDNVATNITNASLDSANTILSGNNNTRG